MSVSMSIERERRYLVSAFDPSILEGRQPKVITQGYFDVLGERSFRVRLIEHLHDDPLPTAVITLKSGSGEAREEIELPIGVEVARVMLSATPYVLQKHRYDVDGFELDLFQGVLRGIVLLEYEVHGDAPMLPPPHWVQTSIDVTDSLTNLHLARLASELPGHAPTAVSFFLEPKLPKIVLTGGPCSGKSTLMREIQQKYGDSVHCVQEVATILISQVGLRPDPNDQVMYTKFQRTLYMVQRAFEDAAEVQAMRDGKRVLILDRGTVDAVAYMTLETTRGRDAVFEALVHRKPSEEISRYAHVIVLAVPPKETYEQHRANNAARSETYEQACVFGERIAEAWRVGGSLGNEHFRTPSHMKESLRALYAKPCARYVDTISWAEKQQAVFSDIECYIRS